VLREEGDVAPRSPLTTRALGRLPSSHLDLAVGIAAIPGTRAMGRCFTAIPRLRLVAGAVHSAPLVVRVPASFRRRKTPCQSESGALEIRCLYDVEVCVGGVHGFSLLSILTV